jgi:gamma-glutamyltranspeptidase/glutathione hydrolase
MRLWSLLLWWSILFLGNGCISEQKKPLDYQAVKTAESNRNMIVAAHPLAVQAGLDLFTKGGNAIDAAVGVQFALAVVCPRAGNLGGGGFMVIRETNRTYHALDYREKAPLAAHRDLYLDSLANVVPDASLKGHLASGVPGTVDGLYKAHERLGKLSWQEVIQPAIELAENGFLISEVEAERLNRYQPDFKQWNTRPNPFTAPRHWQEGDRLEQPDLALTLQAIQEQGAPGFYQGWVADSLLAEMERGHGLITLEDLEAYQAVWREPLVFPYKAYQFITMPPPSSGGIALAQMLGMESQLPAAPSQASEEGYIHYWVEIMRRAYADRATYLGDTDFFPVPQEELMDPTYLGQQAATIHPTTASSSDDLATPSFQVQKEHFETTHTSVVDADGNAVAITTTLNSNYGNKVLVGGAGFFLNNEMDDFSLKPGVPNQFGLIGNEANSIAPGKRMLSSMTPTIVEKEGQLFLALGSPGGSTIITSVLQVFLNVAERDMPLAEAIEKPRFHHQWLPDEIWMEKGGISLPAQRSLQYQGHRISEKASLGRVKAIHILEDGTRVGAGDPRNPDDHAEGN